MNNNQNCSLLKINSLKCNEEKSVFFKSHVGSNANNRLILLATQACSHKHDCKFWQHCTNGFSYLYEDTCPWPNAPEGEYRPLSMSLLYQRDLYLNDRYEELEEYKNKTYPKLTNAIAQALGITSTYSKTEIWNSFICNELCQHFTKQVMTKKSDYLPEDYSAFIHLIKKYNINKVIICGAPGFKFIRELAIKDDIGWEDANGDENAWFHRFYLDNREIIVIYSYHPSYSGYMVYDQKGVSELVDILRMFFSDHLTFMDM